MGKESWSKFRAFSPRPGVKNTWWKNFLPSRNVFFVPVQEVFGFPIPRDTVPRPRKVRGSKFDGVLRVFTKLYRVFSSFFTIYLDTYKDDAGNECSKAKFQTSYTFCATYYSPFFFFSALNRIDENKKVEQDVLSSMFAIQISNAS